MPRVAVIGAGLSGAVIAHELAKADYIVDVFEARDHIGGNCFTRRDYDTGIMLHVYGPHIFHTDNAEVWKFVQQFGDFYPYIHRGRATVQDSIYSIPINLHTINQFFDEKLSPREAKAFLSLQRDIEICEPQNFEEAALKAVGDELYAAFFREYTRKQWGRDPATLPASVFSRLPVRYDYNDGYFTHQYQGIPKEGYTPLIERMMADKRINVHLNSKFERGDSYYHTTFVTGPIDEWFGFSHGRLPYRTLGFKVSHDAGDAQGCAIMNYCDAKIPFTRITEHKHFTPWEHHDQTITYQEYSREAEPGDEPFYPVRLAAEQALLQQYLQMAGDEVGTIFAGRLGTYRYLDMDVTIKEALIAARLFLKPGC